MREMAERAYFGLCLALGRLLRSVTYATTRIVPQDGELRVRKSRSFYAPPLVWMGGLLVRVLDAGVRVLPQREWEERERCLYGRLRRPSVRIDAGGVLVLPRLSGATLATLLEDPTLPEPARRRALERAVAALAELHRLGFTHGDAMAENVLIDLEADVAHWFDFETVHEERRPIAWRRADDVRTLLVTCLVRAVPGKLDETLRLVVDAYRDEAVTRLLEASFTSAWRRQLTYHLSQAGLSFRSFREIARLLRERFDERGGPSRTAEGGSPSSRPDTRSCSALERHRAEARERLRAAGVTRPGAGSVSWRINREVVVVAGWGRAVLLQLAHPLVAAGVDQHSGFHRSPATGLGHLRSSLGRLRSTIAAMLSLTFGDDEEAISAAARINAIHDRVAGRLRSPSGVFPAGETYSAHDAELLRWVHATLLDSSLRTYELLVGPLRPEERQRYCAEAAVMEPLLDIPAGLLPRDPTELDAYVRDVLGSGRIAVTGRSRALARAALFPPRWRLLWPVLRPVQLLTIGLLPDTVRRAYGFEWTQAEVRALARWTTALRWLRRTLPAAVREWPSSRTSTGGKVLPAGPLEIGLSRALHVREERVSARLDACRLLYVSDIHLRNGRSHTLCRQVLDAVTRCRPDAVLLGGDLVDGRSELSTLSRLVGGLRDVAPVLAIGGNHDHRIGLHRVREAVVQGGGRWIHDGVARVTHAGRVIVVSGPDSAPLVEGHVRVLCAHDPRIWKRSRHAGYDLVLAGHLHGCQVVAWEYRDRLLPGAIFYPYCFLRRRSGSTRLVVSRGVSDRVPIRWRCPREVVLCHV